MKRRKEEECLQVGESPAGAARHNTISEMFDRSRAVLRVAEKLL